MISVISVSYQILFMFSNIILFLCIRFLTTFVLLRSWFIVWLFVVVNQIYSYDVLYILGQCALRIDESENICIYLCIYICMYVCMYIRIYVLCMYISMCTCLYVHMGVLNSEKIPPSVPLYKLFSCVMKNGVGAT